MRSNSERFRILLILLLLTGLWGCKDAGRETADPNERYVYIIDMIREHEVFADHSDYFDISAEMANIKPADDSLRLCAVQECGLFNGTFRIFPF